MDKKTILALVLSALVLFGYQFYVAKYYPLSDITGPAKHDLGAGKSEENAVEEYSLPTAKEEEPVIETKQPAIPAKEVDIETEKYVVTLSNEGGYIKSIILKEYPDPRTKGAFKLVDIEDPAEGIFNIEGLLEGGHSKLRYAVERQGNEVVFSARLQNGLEIIKRYIFHNALYHINLELNFMNSAGHVLKTDYSIVAGSNIDIANKIDRRYMQVVSEVSGKPRRDNNKKFIDGIVHYTGLQNKYFSLITKTSVPTKGAVIKQVNGNNLLSAILIDKFTIIPDSTTSHNFLLYVGPSKEEIMEPYGLSSAVSYGFFGGISKILLSGLRLFRRIFRNWGVAILLLSACVNLILFPLSRKSYDSMKKMQELQPHMDRLRSEHKDNPQKLNKEMMELYKKYNVNPMGGCLPMLLQMPIFIALYQALMRSLELRGAKFLWIRDLSMPDAVRLPFAMPLIGNSINILPVLMAVAMVFQQKVSTRKNQSVSTQAKQQQQMMVMMPVLFLFIMYNFPSGLVLYWLTNTVLTMFEQRAIMHG